MQFPRSSGILMPVFSLPDAPEIGDLGPAAYRFVDFLQTAGQTIWQLLPLGPPARGDSPYSSYSAFAGNPLLISCEKLMDEGLLTRQQIQSANHVSDISEAVDYDRARRLKPRLLKAAFETFQAAADDGLRENFRTFCTCNQSWLDDFARFDALIADGEDADWTTWDAGLVHRLPQAIEDVDHRLHAEIQFAKFEQFLFASQWQQLKSYANDRGVRIYGDMPIFVAFESVDVWTNQDMFRLDDDGRPLVVAGVPPDYFSSTGQMWGNPLYDWDRMAETRYEWWTSRFRQAFEYFDILRIDHFRGFESFWEIPADAENATSGQWKPGPAGAPFAAARDALGDLAIVAEDLGLITDAVHHLRDELGFPGMRVVQFGFEDEHDSYHRPDSYPQHSVAYTGTHDNDTVVGWYRQRLESGADQNVLNRILSGNADRVHADLAMAVLNSAADTTILPMQDVLGLGSEARMNTPGEADGNWTWRCSGARLTDALAKELRSMTESSGRI